MVKLELKPKATRSRGRWPALAVLVVSGSAIVGYLVGTSQSSHSIELEAPFEARVIAISASADSVCVERLDNETLNDSCGIPIFVPELGPVAAGDRVTITPVWLKDRGDSYLAFYVVPEVTENL